MFLNSIKGFRYHVLTLHLSEKKTAREGWGFLPNYRTSAVGVKISKKKDKDQLHGFGGWAQRGLCTLVWSLGQRAEPPLSRITHLFLSHPSEPLDTRNDLCKAYLKCANFCSVREFG